MAALLDWVPSSWSPAPSCRRLSQSPKWLGVSAPPTRPGGAGLGQNTEETQKLGQDAQRQGQHGSRDPQLKEESTTPISALALLPAPCFCPQKTLLHGHGPRTVTYLALLSTKESLTMTTGPSSGHSESWYWLQSSHPASRGQCQRGPCLGRGSRRIHIQNRALPRRGDHGHFPCPWHLQPGDGQGPHRTGLMRVTCLS